MSTYSVPCPFCGSRRARRFDTDGNGGTVEIVAPCLACPDGRRVAGVCRDCPAPVEGTVGKALRCARCKRAALREAGRRYRERHPDRERARLKRWNAKRRTPEVRAKERIREREYRSRPEVRERDRQRRRRRAIEAPHIKRERNRRYRERHPERVREQQRRQNEKRREQMREYLHRYYTKYVGPGRKPTCTDCGAEVPWAGRGRPRKRCEACAERGTAQTDNPTRRTRWRSWRS